MDDKFMTVARDEQEELLNDIFKLIKVSSLNMVEVIGVLESLKMTCYNQAITVHLNDLKKV